MGKIREGYGIWSNNKDGLRTRSSVPTQANITAVDGTPDYIDCVNISMSQIASVIGVTAGSLYDLCRHANVNRWSEFCPVSRAFSGSGYTTDLVNSVPSAPYKLSDFAGYNHNALAPGWQSGGQADAEADLWININSKAQIEAKICIGEIDWSALGAYWAVMLIFDSGDSIVGWGKQDITTAANNFNLYGETTNTVGADTSGWYGRLLICDNPNLNSSEDVESALLCRIPNITTFDINIKVKASSTWKYSGTNNQTLPDSWIQNGAAGMNWTTGVFNIGSIAHTQNKNVKIKVTMYDWLTDVVTSGYIVGSDLSYFSYEAGGDDITGTVDLGDNIALYGYLVVVEFYYSS